MVTFVDVRVEVAVFLGVRSNLAVVLVDEDAHLGKQLHLLLVQVICGYLRHSDRRL